MNQKGFAPMIILIVIALGIIGYFAYKIYFSQISKVIPTTSADKSTVCKNAGGKWLDQYQECESTTALDKQFCKKNGGRFLECESPCRHEPQMQFCAQVCTKVCKFNQ